MSERPEAIRLAELLEAGPRRSGDAGIAAELRRLHAEVEALKADRQRVPVAITRQQALALWHISHDANNRIRAFEWFHAGIIAAEHFHGIAAAPEAPAQASAVDERDRKDAERYRYLRDGYMPSGDPQDWDEMDQAIAVGGDALDAHIDEARAALEQKGGAA